MHPLSRLHSTLRCIALRYHFVLSTQVLKFSFAQTAVVIFVWCCVLDCFLFDIARSSQINACKGVDLTRTYCTSLAGCITEPLQEEQVLLSSLLPAYHTHMQDPYNQATLHDDGSHY
jgi:hypothetical protein